ncbi:hypothetical protein [Amycolatopsis anabasis]|uniref:hypothetical protein n=1 Tax=Amycolatopsis anabasis TaxID=1840409 RepID=UPI001FEC59CA|nr:hypothetical protein [Amycolatopsis anabasis]
MMDPLTDQRSRRRAGVRLGTIVITVVALAGIVAALLVARSVTAPPRSSPQPQPSTAPVPIEPGWDTAAEAALAAHPMLSLPLEAAQPQELTTQTAGPDISIPAPSTVVGRWIPDGFPSTPEGALAQLKAINEVGSHGGDPTTYARAYTESAMPGAPSVDGSGLHRLLSRFRTRAGIPAGQPKPGLTVSYEVTHGVVKGTTDGGRYTVVCTLGQLSFDFQGQTTTFGVGDCQAMRWTGAAWRISRGPRAAYAPLAWPGSLPSVQAGYRALTGGGGR